MSVFPVKLPDVGEGVAEAELIGWLVAVGDDVTPESPLAEVMTDKVTVEISSPVTGVVTALNGEPGDMLAVGTELVAIEIGGDAEPSGASGDAPADASPSEPLPEHIADDTGDAAEDAPERDAEPATSAPAPQPPRSADRGSRPTAAPAVRRRARELGIDLADIDGSGPDGRVVHADLDRRLSRGGLHQTGPAEARVEPVRGLRRQIAERLSQSWAEIPHITYVDEVDATALEALRAELNRRADGDDARLTLLPFIVRALVVACTEQPRLNAHYDAEQRAVSVFDAVHVGIATQTDDGLMVPVVRHAEQRGLRDIAAEVSRIASAARDGSATRDDLSGSTITITSLGALGGLMTTPIINRPEVAIVGINKMETRPVWRDGTVVPRTVFNLSSSFDHRIVDGWDAATFVQRLKALLEMPALLFADHDQ